MKSWKHGLVWSEGGITGKDIRLYINIGGRTKEASDRITGNNIAHTVCRTKRFNWQSYCVNFRNRFSRWPNLAGTTMLFSSPVNQYTTSGHLVSMYQQPLASNRHEGLPYRDARLLQFWDREAVAARLPL